MLEHVRQSGVTVIRDHVRGLKVTGGRVHGVLTSKSKINAHFVIDGTGGGHLVARLLGMPIEQRSHQLFAKYGYVKGIVPLSKNAPHLSFNSTGWTWIAPVDRDLTQWTRLDLVRSVSKSQSKTLSSRPKELDSLPAIGRTLGADVTWRIVNKPAGHGYFIAGDAAAVVDPAASDGFIRSVLSGRLAGHLASQVLCSGMAEEFAAEQYAFWIQGQFARCVTKLDQVYSTAFPGWKTSSASQGMDT
jgi:flavin-dependent dehydrogenase